MTKRLLAVTLLLAALALPLLAAANGGAVHVVEIKDYSFNPAEITVKVGDTIRWENHEKRQYHSVWFEEAGDPEADYFFPGESVERTFDKPGDFPYHCGPHAKEMKGVVHVK